MTSPARAVVNRGAILHLEGDLSGAEAAYREALSVDDGNPTAYANLGFLLATQGRHDEARECYVRSLSIDPTRSATWTNAGITELWLGDVDAGMDALVRAVRLDPHDAHAWDALARVHASGAQWRDAEHAWASSIAADDSNEDAWVSLATMLSLQDRSAEAAVVLRDAAARFPASARVAVQLAALCIVRQDFGSAAEALSHALALEPDDPGAQFHTGLLAVVSGSPEEAAPYLEDVAERGGAFADQARRPSAAVATPSPT